MCSTHQTYAKVKSTGLLNFRNSYPNEANLGAINTSWVVLLWNDFGFWLQKLLGKKNNPGTQVFDVPPRHNRTAHRMFHRMFHPIYVRRTPTDYPHRPKQLHAVPYPARQPATQLDLDHHSSPVFINTVSSGHVDQPPCPPTVSPHHRVSHKCRQHSSPPWPSCSCSPAETNTRRRAPNRRFRIAAFAAHPVQRSMSVLRRLPSRLLRATLASTLSSVCATCVVFATRVLTAVRTWWPRWRARSRTVAAHVFSIDAAVAEVVFTSPFCRLPRGRATLRLTNP